MLQRIVNLADGQLGLKHGACRGGAYSRSSGVRQDRVRRSDRRPALRALDDIADDAVWLDAHGAKVVPEARLREAPRRRGELLPGADRAVEALGAR
jgi:hypothetical protein